MNDWVLRGFDESYRRMGVSFDHTQYESQTYKLGKEIIGEGLQRGVLKRLADGAVVCDLSQVGLKGEKVLLRSDGTSVYMTQDLGTAAERFDRFRLDHLVYVVGDEQVYHFDVLFRILGLLRPGLREACYHLAYGMIRLPEGKMKSREGTVVDADDLMDEMHRLARLETEARAAEGKAHTEGLSEAELEHRAERIAMAAIKYYLLKFTPRKSFEYDPRESIDFLGQTGPYCLFNYARTRSLLRRAGEEPPFCEAAADRLQSERELEVIRRLADWPQTVARAAAALDPSRIAEYLFELCKSFAFIFTDKANHPIVTCEDPELRQGRLMLVAAVGHTLWAGLQLLGIEPLEEM
jgi:arginyl-tRNA synthetase